MADDPEIVVARLRKEAPDFFEKSDSKKKPEAQLELVRERIAKAEGAWRDKYKTYIANFEDAMRIPLERPKNTRLAGDMLSVMRKEHAEVLLEVLCDAFKESYKEDFIINAFNKHGYKAKVLKKDAYTQVWQYLTERMAFVANSNKYSPNSKKRRIKAYNEFGPSMAMTKTLNATNSKKVKKDEWAAVKAKWMMENPDLMEENFSKTTHRLSEETLKKKLATAVRKSLARTKKAEKPKIKEAWAARLLSDFKEYENLNDFQKILQFASVRGTYDELKARMQAKFDKVTARSNKKLAADKISTALHNFFELDKKSKCFTVKLSCAEKISSRRVEAFETVMNKFNAQ